MPERIFIELCTYSEGTANILGKRHFWFAYHPNHPRNPFQGAPGDTPDAAVKRMMAKHPELRRAA